MSRHGHIDSYSVSFGTYETFADFYFFVTDVGLSPAGGSQVSLCIVGIELFEINILDVGADVGKTSRNMSIVTDYHARQAGRRNARHTYVRRSEMDHVPNRRGGCAGMRTICHYQ